MPIHTNNVHFRVLPESACNVGDLASVPGLGRSLGEGKGYPLLYSGLENSRDCIVHGVAKSQTQLSDLHFHARVEWLDPFVKSSLLLQNGRIYLETKEQIRD